MLLLLGLTVLLSPPRRNEQKTRDDPRSHPQSSPFVVASVSLGTVHNRPYSTTISTDSSIGLSNDVCCASVYSTVIVWVPGSSLTSVAVA
jgi:hypothetical protein